MAITQVRAQFNGQWYMLTYNEDARAYQTTITPDTFSGGQPDGYYDVTVEATNDSGVVVTTDGDNLLGLRLVVRETIQPILTLVSPEAGYVTTNTPAVTWTAQDNDGGSGYGTGNWKTQETKNWLVRLGVQETYCIKDGNQVIE